MAVLSHHRIYVRLGDWLHITWRQDTATAVVSSNLALLEQSFDKQVHPRFSETSKSSKKDLLLLKSDPHEIIVHRIRILQDCFTLLKQRNIGPFSSIIAYIPDPLRSSKSHQSLKLVSRNRLASVLKSLLLISTNLGTKVCGIRGELAIKSVTVALLNVGKIVLVKGREDIGSSVGNLVALALDPGDSLAGTFKSRFFSIADLSTSIGSG